MMNAVKLRAESYDAWASEVVDALKATASKKSKLNYGMASWIVMPTFPASMDTKGAHNNADSVAHTNWPLSPEGLWQNCEPYT